MMTHIQHYGKLNNCEKMPVQSTRGRYKHSATETMNYDDDFTVEQV